MLYFLIIILICLLYIHIKYYIEYSSNDKIYELDVVSKHELDKITYLKYPITFNYTIDSCYNLQKINIIDISNNYNELLLKKRKAHKLLNLSDYYSQYNDLSNQINDTLFRPITTIKADYDILFGHTGVTTKLTSEYAYRTIFVVIDGNIDITLIHPNNSNTLNEQLNCKYMVRESSYNIWTNKLPKHKILYLKKGRAISVPMYWWWSIKFGDSAKVLQFKYYTFINKVVLLPILTQIWLNN